MRLNIQDTNMNTYDGTKCMYFSLIYEKTFSPTYSKSYFENEGIYHGHVKDGVSEVPTCQFTCCT